MIENLFSVPIFRTMMGPHSIDLELYHPTRSAWDGETKTTFGHDRMVLESLPNIKSEIEGHTFNFIKAWTNQDTHRVSIDSSWINFSGQGDCQYEHDHIGSDISGVYYMHVPDESGVIKFQNPITQFRYISIPCINDTRFWDLNAYSSPNASYQPSTGELILFPSFLRHSVLPNLSKEHRITLAFNAFIKRGEETQ